jgi:hypothetical protein
VARFSEAARPVSESRRASEYETARSNIVSKSDNRLPENSKQSLDKKLDHAVEETFPASDPVSVSITKGGAIDYGDKGVSSASDTPSKPEQKSTAEHIVTEAKEKLSETGSTVSEAAHEAYAQGSRYVREVMHEYPEAERYYRQGTAAVRRQAAENPLLTLVLGLGIGYALAWMIHGVGSGGTKGVPDYARTRRVYAPRRD